ncbi:MAG TPA: hypothetical protein VGB59_05595 [Allosphingosinicella sp.]|jgi:hypothetical protein
MKKAASLATAVSASTLALLLASLSLHRASLPYNEEGRHFDAADSVVYTDGAATTYGVLGALLGAAAVAAGLWAWRVWRG